MSWGLMSLTAPPEDQDSIQHQQEGSQPSKTPFPEIPTPFLWLPQVLHTHGVYTHAERTLISKIKIKIYAKHLYSLLPKLFI